VSPDFTCSGANTFIDFIHRRAGHADIYFLANRNNREAHVTCTMRVSGKKPEFWDPVTGAVRDASAYAEANGLVSVAMDFPAYGSQFVILRTRATPPPAATTTLITFQPLQELTGPWAVTFDPAWLYPTTSLTPAQAAGHFRFDTLCDWSKRPEDAVRHYSGTGTYHLDFNAMQHDRTTRTYLDIGTLERGTAHIRLNGKDLGVLWCAPWRVDITDALLPQGNQLDIAVVNLWPNRLIGDAGLPANEQRTRTNIRVFKKDDALLPSGLVGPVTVLVRVSAAASTH
jgi:hypothetical protein